MKDMYVVHGPEFDVKFLPTFDSMSRVQGSDLPSFSYLSSYGWMTWRSELDSTSLSCLETREGINKEERSFTTNTRSPVIF